ncbi:hypothetical protein RRG08_005903 [Elysia crispata]|uniref:Uncharacterized protein n=1 Tax=Elysia crispata TaxID=231223 RepID=A0AAE0Y4H1_9GAST|nr:hypothetical protein RRG08_005903 [Elysia crispata]
MFDASIVSRSRFDTKFRARLPSNERGLPFNRPSMLLTDVNWINNFSRCLVSTTQVTSEMSHSAEEQSMSLLMSYVQPVGQRRYRTRLKPFPLDIKQTLSTSPRTARYVPPALNVGEIFLKTLTLDSING